MRRKWTVLAVTAVGVALLTAGFSIAQVVPLEPLTPLAKIMEQVNKSNLTITKGVRTAVAYAKSRKDVVENAQLLVKLGQEARAIPDAAKAQQKSYAEWTQLMDNFIKVADGFAKDVSKTSTPQAQAKIAYREVSKACTTCHEVFRIEEDF
jgi:cytochrome c556